jgi:RNA polymerase sigma factor (sigma-70 family)
VDGTDDRALWRRAQDGDADAFGVLFERHFRSVFNHCLRRTANVALADDLASIVFLEAWQLRRKVRLERPSALPWLLGVAVNVLRNQRRSLRRHDAALRRLGSAVAPADFTEESEQRIACEQEMRMLLPLLERLSPRDLETLELCAWSGLTQEEAAAALGIPHGTVRSRLNRARSRIADLAREQGLEPAGVVAARRES